MFTLLRSFNTLSFSPLSLNMPGWPRLSWCGSLSATIRRWTSCCRSRRSCRRGCPRRREHASSWLWNSTELKVRFSGDVCLPWKKKVDQFLCGPESLRYTNIHCFKAFNIGSFKHFSDNVCLHIRMITQNTALESIRSMCLGEGGVTRSDGISCLKGRVKECETICGEKSTNGNLCLNIWLYTCQLKYEIM